MRTNNPRKKPHTGERKRINFNKSEPHTLAIFEALADGGTHVEDDVIAACAPLVPPHRAHRHGENQRTAQRRQSTPNEVVAIASSQRRIIQQKLRGIERNGNATRDSGFVSLHPDVVADYLVWKATNG